MQWKITSSRFHVSIEDRVATVTPDCPDRHHAPGSQDNLATSVPLNRPAREREVSGLCVPSIWYTIYRK
jgi:hypothetical protein